MYASNNSVKIYKTKIDKTARKNWQDFQKFSDLIDHVTKIREHMQTGTPDFYESNKTYI